MQEKLIIYMHAKDIERPSWLILNNQGLITEKQDYANPEKLTELANDRMVQVYVPAQDVLLTQTALQTMSRSRLMQILPYALEDQLIDEVEQLHFAIGEYHASSSLLQVAVTSHAKIKEWLKILTHWGIEPHVMISCIHCLPWEKETWQILSIDDAIVVRTGEVSGFTTEPINLSALLKIAAIQPKKIIFYAEESTALIDFLPIEYKLIANNQWLLIDAAFAEPTAINLLQGPYASKRSGFFQKNNLIKLCIGLFCTFLALLLTYPIVSYFLLKNKTQAINLQINQIYRYHFPKAASVIAPQIRLSDKLKQLQAGANEQPLLTYLTYLGQAINQTPSITLKRLTYQQNQLSVELKAVTSADFSAFINFLNKQGLNVKQQNANFTGASINATITIQQ